MTVFYKMVSGMQPHRAGLAPLDSNFADGTLMA